LRGFGHIDTVDYTGEFLIAALADAGKTNLFYSHNALRRRKLNSQVDNLLIDTKAFFPDDVVGDVGIGPTHGHILRGRGNIAVKQKTDDQINIRFEANMVLPKFRSRLIPRVIVTGQ
jgi:hypothetical protein